MASITRVINLARHNQSSRRDTSFVMSYPNAAPDEWEGEFKDVLGLQRVYGETAAKRRQGAREQRE